MGREIVPWHPPVSQLLPAQPRAQSPQPPLRALCDRPWHEVHASLAGVYENIKGTLPQASSPVLKLEGQDPPMNFET